jgi:pSer/pThr/pTyr-binding forkhead associated (FHA) protein
MAKQAKTVTNTLTSDFVVAEPHKQSYLRHGSKIGFGSQQAEYLSEGHQMGNSPWTLCPKAE